MIFLKTRINLYSFKLLHKLIGHLFYLNKFGIIRKLSFSKNKILKMEQKYF